MGGDFKTQLYEDAKRLFPPGVVESQVAAPKMFEPPNPAVRLIHTPTGITAGCDEYESQTENYIAAAIRLRIACDERNV
jgi:hypothetical protein